MIKQTVLTVVSWIAVLTMFAFIGYRLGVGYFPENVFDIRMRPAYTETAFEDLLLEKIYYEKSYKEIEKVLGE